MSPSYKYSQPISEAHPQEHLVYKHTHTHTHMQFVHLSCLSVGISYPRTQARNTSCYHRCRLSDKLSFLSQAKADYLTPEKKTHMISQETCYSRFCLFIDFPDRGLKSSQITSNLIFSASSQVWNLDRKFLLYFINKEGEGESKHVELCEFSM